MVHDFTERNFLQKSVIFWLNFKKSMCYTRSTKEIVRKSMKEFESVIGYESVKKELERMCDVLIHSEKYTRLGVKHPSGLLLHGDPGVGKTTMAKCFIEACGRRAFTCRKLKPDGDFVNEITRTFEDAKKAAPSIVFLDDMDKFANDDSNHRNSEEYVTVQSCIDDVKGKDVFVLATANSIRNLPDSLLRAGRFDKIIEVNTPTGKEAEDIIAYYLGQKRFVADVNVSEIARILDGKSCADLETVINEAGIYAGFDGRENIDMDDIIRACMRVIFNAPESLDGYSDEVVEKIAYHEAGHAVVAEILEPNSVNIVSVCTHDSCTGGITSLYQSKDYFSSKHYMENRVRCLLAGRAATEVKYGDVDVGANSDIHRAFSIVERFVDDYCSTGFDRFETRTTTAATAQRKEMQVTSEMERYYAEARKILIQNREPLDKLAAALVEKKTIIARDIKAIKATCKRVA